MTRGYRPTFTDLAPTVEDRWRRIRAFIGAWHELALPDRRSAELVDEIEARVGHRLPASFRSYVNLSSELRALQASYPNGQVTDGYSKVLRDRFEVTLLDDHGAITVMSQVEGDCYWAVRLTDLLLEDPPIHRYELDPDPDASTMRYAHTARQDTTITSFVVGHLMSFLQRPNGAGFGIDVDDPEATLAELAAVFPHRSALDEIEILEAENRIASLQPNPYERSHILGVHLWDVPASTAPPEQLWQLSTRAGWRYGVFAERR